jgi:hypothetical protein
MRKYVTLENALHVTWALLSAGIILFGTYLFNRATEAQASQAATDVKVVEQEKQSEKQFKLLQDQIDRRFGEIRDRLSRIETKMEKN